MDEDTIFSIPNPLVSIDSVGVGFHEVFMAVVNEGGCTDRICKTIEIIADPLIWAPTAFTPNNGNLNEVFKPVINDESQVQLYEFSVFNRIGRRIFSTRDMNASCGNNLIEERKRPIGTYLWTVTLKIKDIKYIVSYSGIVMILK
ncbi:MAG: hypothetical protein ACI8XB_000150 [Patiriisocius sp.]